jgi:trimeric autotransporter adhesin
MWIRIRTRDSPARPSRLPGQRVAGFAGVPWHKAFAPRLGLAWRVPKIKQTVVRAGFGMNYTVGEYAGFATTMAHQPPFANEQTNRKRLGNDASSACARTVPATCFTLANGFPAPDTIGNYALDPHYPLPYVQVWNLDVQKTLPWGIVMNLGYNGSKGNHLDITSAPRATAEQPGHRSHGCRCSLRRGGGVSKLNAGTVRVNKRLSKGISLGANYQYSHAIDDAGAVGGTGGVVVQNWQNPAGEEGPLELRHSPPGERHLSLRVTFRQKTSSGLPPAWLAHS